MESKQFRETLVSLSAQIQSRSKGSLASKSKNKSPANQKANLQNSSNCGTTVTSDSTTGKLGVSITAEPVFGIVSATISFNFVIIFWIAGSEVGTAAESELGTAGGLSATGNETSAVGNEIISAAATGSGVAADVSVIPCTDDRSFRW